MNFPVEFIQIFDLMYSFKIEIGVFGYLVIVKFVKGIMALPDCHVLLCQSMLISSGITVSLIDQFKIRSTKFD